MGEIVLAIVFWVAVALGVALFFIAPIVGMIRKLSGAQVLALFLLSLLIGPFAVIVALLLKP